MARDRRSYLITGASSGLGAELAKQLCERGDRLALVARREDRLAEVGEAAARAARARGIADPFPPLLLVADVSDKEALRAAIDRAFEELPGGVDVLVLNAGIGQEQPPHRFDPEVSARIVDVNLTANVRAVGYALPRMMKRGSGHIVGVSSLAAYRGLPRSSPYCASKAGFSTFLESLRLELPAYGIDVTTISPGFVKTELTAKNKSMPFLMEADDAVRRMIRGMDRRKREVRFPFPLALLVRLGRAMPDCLFDLATRRRTRHPSFEKPGA